MKIKGLLFGCATGLLLLSACSDEAKQDLGLIRTTPDEFAVVARAPLSVPPDYTLRPPVPGANRPMELSPKEDARQTVFGKQDVGQSTSSPSGGFMDRIGTTQSNPNIRTLVDQESADGIEDDRTTIEKLGIIGNSDPDAGTPIDPVDEYQRLQNDGQIVIIKRNEDIEAP
jgi:hypothetical protein